MKKILLSLISIAVVSGLVGGSAYALFSDKVQASGITLATGNADLQISKDNNSWATSSLSFSEILADQMYPGFGNDNSVYGKFYLKNASTFKIKLSVKAQLPSGGVTETVSGSWNALKDAIQVAVNTEDDTAGTGYHTLAEWNSGAISFLGTPIEQDQSQGYKVYIRIPLTRQDSSEIGNEIAGYWLSNVKMDIVGTQSN